MQTEDSRVVKATSFALKKETEENENYRTALWTGPNSQLVLMNLGPNESFDREAHAADQMFFVVTGSLLMLVDPTDPTCGSGVVTCIPKGGAFCIAGGATHYVKAGPCGAKLYTVYAPPNHPYDVVRQRK